MKKIVRYIKEEIITVPENNDKLLNKNILIVAATSDIGVVIVDSFIRSGARVYVTARAEDKLRSCFQSLPDEQKFLFDADNPYTIEKIFEYFSNNNINVDFVVNCAGVIQPNEKQGLFGVDEFDWEKSMTVNFYSNVLLSDAFDKYCEQNNHNGTFIIISSIDGTKSASSLYAISKSLLNCFIEDCGGKYNNVKVFGIAPGPTATKMMNANLKFTYFRVDHPDSRCAVPQDVANLVLEVCDSNYILKTVSILKTDGGYTL